MANSGEVATPALVVKELSSGYRGSQVLHRVELAIPAGVIYAVVGKNGMGKTTLLRTILGLLPATTGSIKIFGDEVANQPAYRVARLGVSYLPQEKALFQDLTVDENLRLGSRDGRGYRRNTPASH